MSHLDTTRPPSDPDQLIAEHGILVRHIARKVFRTGGGSVEMEELVQTGMLALVHAARAFVDRGEASFATYASMRVRGAMIDLLRSSATINRGAMRERRRMKETEQALRGQLGRDPNAEEMAGALGLSAAAYHNALGSAQPIYLEALDDAYSDRSAAFASDAPDAFQMIEQDRLRGALADAIARLPQREAQVVRWYFVEDKTLDEIGQTLAVGAARVCQIKKQALDRMRGRLAPAYA